MKAGSWVLVIVAEVDASTLSELRINKNTIQRDEQLFSDLSRDINWGEKSTPISIILNAEEGLTTNEQGLNEYTSFHKVAVNETEEVIVKQHLIGVVCESRECLTIAFFPARFLQLSRSDRLPVDIPLDILFLNCSYEFVKLKVVITIAVITITAKANTDFNRTFHVAYYMHDAILGSGNMTIYRTGTIQNVTKVNIHCGFDPFKH
ncbi:12583_t:CDS:2 [Funneliformis geosporum]|uniref:12583_t:CDS:1 n=1 Tax=Funneliformis geosporum TaxID=1117311 RepID=A0A9W4WRT5_9GLOM|nr:12583_t:CDS:2 [Funneliformis geosporum]